MFVVAHCHNSFLSQGQSGLVVVACEKEAPFSIIENLSHIRDEGMNENFYFKHFN